MAVTVYGADLRQSGTGPVRCHWRLGSIPPPPPPPTAPRSPPINETALALAAAALAAAKPGKDATCDAPLEGVQYPHLDIKAEFDLPPEALTEDALEKALMGVELTLSGGPLAAFDRLKSYDSDVEDSVAV